MAEVSNKQPMTGCGVAKVIDSGHQNFRKGDLVWGMTGWKDYIGWILIALILNFVGLPGLTAYAGFYEFSVVLLFLPSTIFLPKFDLLKDKYGFDEAFNYKEEHDLDKALKRCLPDGIDIYFENVGGKMLDVVLLNMRLHGRIPMCGMISQYNLEEREGAHNLIRLITKQVRMEGFLVSDYFPMYPKYRDMVLPFMREGKITCVEDIAEGLENAPAALVGVFSGRNVGKQVVLVAHE
ncbi:hypothetical protein RHMOL_Rhmol09G0007300 [Rhododendron molle]|uniref:Uncharacterized protein n=1 Tax=Rhododendron molle TaxID=49168 RepID=A0ACC0M9H1_RHOML|nr:hypothetical protein RHMOL_Rhmol09G0007300 [Rhododendron molle]